MISIIICSRKKSISSKLLQNINNTIGIPYELIFIDNSNNEYSIFSAYNLGVKQANHPILCFMHDDILYHTQDWGKKVVDHFLISNIGIIGVAGSYYLSELPGAWWNSIFSSMNVMQTMNGETVCNKWNYIVDGKSSHNAVMLDGLWLCIPQKVMSLISFDEKTYSGFHCYDSDICLQIKKLNYEVRIVDDIEIEHLSVGKRDKSWLINIFIFYNKWKKELPKSVINVSKSLISQNNFFNAKQILEEIKTNNLGIIYSLKIWKYYLRCNPIINKRNWIYFLVLVKKLYFPHTLKE